ncbi:MULTISPECIES: sensor histidine kinase [unclassified Paenibacillus]|uniref:sensor histidine kinase n=1 Tax=unclassified Paenibacillus TaxID=185978 RepID=UPI0036298454
MRKLSGKQLGIILLYVLGVLLCALAPLALFWDSPSVINISGSEHWALEVREAETEASSGKTSADRYRIRTILPSTTGTDLVLQVKEKRDYTLYVGGIQLYAYHYDPRNGAREAFVGSFIKLSPDAYGQTLEVELEHKHGQPQIGSYLLGTMDALQADLLKRDALKLTLTVLFTAFCLMALGLYAANRQEHAYGYFSLLSCTLGYATWVRSNLSHLATDLWWLDSIHDLSLPVGIFAWVGFIETMVRKDSLQYRYIRWMRHAAGCVIILCVLAAVTSRVLYDFLLITLVPCVLALTFIASFMSIQQGMASISPLQRREAGVLRFSCVNLLIVVGLHILVNYPNSAGDMLREHIPLLFNYWSYDQIFVSIFLFDLCLGYILVVRVMMTYRQVHAYALELSSLTRSLEDRVSERTKQLEITMREALEALEQIALLEERNRIAQEIHDTLGHHLVGTITQLEAAKRLLSKKPDLVLDKLNLAQRAVRQGLDEVRTVIHAMNDSLVEVDLRVVLNDLLVQTSSMMEVQVESRIGELPPLDALQKRMLYRALQEGLTNGIKHGLCHRFDFQLDVQDIGLNFLLRNDGEPYRPTLPGMGLAAMRDRIGLLGGEVSILTAQDGWTELRLYIPLHQPFIEIAKRA